MATEVAGLNTNIAELQSRSVYITCPYIQYMFPRGARETAPSRTVLTCTYAVLTCMYAVREYRFGIILTHETYRYSFRYDARTYNTVNVQEYLNQGFKVFDN